MKTGFDKYNQKYSYRVQLNSAEISTTGTISYGTTNFRELFPSTAVANSMTLTPYARTSAGLAYLSAMEVSLNGEPFTSKDIDGRINVGRSSLYGNCRIGGTLKQGSKVGVVDWAPIASGTFICDMEPYPGNK